MCHVHLAFGGGVGGGGRAIAKKDSYFQNFKWTISKKSSKWKPLSTMPSLSIHSFILLITIINTNKNNQLAVWIFDYLARCCCRCRRLFYYYFG